MTFNNLLPIEQVVGEIADLATVTQKVSLQTDAITSWKPSDYIPINQIYIDYSCQRRVDTKRVNKINGIIRNFKSRYFTRPRLTKLDDEHYVCIDGQARIVAAIRHGNSSIPADFDQPKENVVDYCKDLFVSQHENEAPVSGWDNHEVMKTMNETYVNGSGKSLTTRYNTAKDIQKILDYGGQSYTFSTTPLSFKTLQLSFTANTKSISLNTAFESVSRLSKKQKYLFESDGISVKKAGSRNPMFVGEILKVFAQHFSGDSLVGHNLDSAGEYVRQEYISEMKKRDPENLPDWHWDFKHEKDKKRKNCKINSSILIDQVNKLNFIFLKMCTRHQTAGRGKFTQSNLKEILETRGKANAEPATVGANKLREYYNQHINS